MSDEWPPGALCWVQFMDEAPWEAVVIERDVFLGEVYSVRRLGDQYDKWWRVWGFCLYRRFEEAERAQVLWALGGR